MAWKIRRSSKETTSSKPLVRQHNKNLKSCLRNESDHSCSDAASQSSTVNCAQSGFTQRSLGSRSSNSRSSEVSSGRADEVVEQFTIGSKGSRNSSGSGQASRISYGSGKVTTNSGSQRSAKSQSGVRFSAIHVREYERILGDNPSCSCGPSIGIGWSHSETHVYPLINHKRGQTMYGRKSHLEMVLTREEREKLLCQWGASDHDIASATRANIKAKHQRRQTVRNLHKIDKLEEGLETAARRLKRVLFLKRRSGSKSKKLLQQAEIAAKIMTELNLKEAQNDGQSQPQRPQPVVSEPEEDYLEHLEVNVSMARYPEGSMVRTSSASTFYDEDAASCITGLALGNSTTASVVEMDRFYQELEFEMFGEEELPNMLGQTLALPGVEIPEEERVYTDPESVCGSPIPPSISSSLPSSSATVPAIDEEEQEQPSQGHSPEHYGACFPNYGQYGYPMYMMSQPQFPMQRAYQVYEEQMQGRMRGEHRSATPHSTNARLRSSSLDSADVYTPVVTPRNTSMVDRQYHHQAFALAPAVFQVQRDHYYARQQYDGPRIAHMPPSHISPTNWMEGHNAAQAPRGYACEPVTISEDAYEDDQQRFMGEPRPLQRMNYGTYPLEQPVGVTYY